MPDDRDRTVGLRGMSDAELLAFDYVPAVTDPVPVGKVSTGEWRIEELAGVAHRIPVCITSEQAAAQAQAEQMALLQQLIDTPIDSERPELGQVKHQVATLEGIIDWFISNGAPLTRPVNPTVALKVITEFGKALEDAAEASQNLNLALQAIRSTRKGTTLKAALDEANARGITAAQINAAWEYMQATGQVPEI